MTQKTSQSRDGLYLGKPVFGVTHEGEIRRTAVSSLHTPYRPGRGVGDELSAIMDHALACGDYSVLDGSLGRTFFSLDEAIAEAKKVLNARLGSRDITRRQEERARAYLSKLGTKAGREEVLTQPLVEKCVAGFMGDRILKREDEKFPTEYFRPGERVYGIITPGTHSCVSLEWRPRPYFVLVTRVDGVSYAPQWPGGVYYRLVDTHYTIPHPHLCGGEEEAREKMTTIFSEETDGVIPPERIKFFDVSAGKRAHDEMLKKIVESVRAECAP